MLFYGIIQLIPGDFNNHNLLDKANHGCKGQEDRMQTEERLPFLWGVNYYTDSFTLKICTFNNSIMFNYCTTLYFSDAFHNKSLGNYMTYTNIYTITKISSRTYTDN